MLVTLLGIVTVARLLQLEKAALPMLVTLLGIITEVRPLQPEKAELPMLVTSPGTTYSVISFPSLSINSTGFPMELIQPKVLLLQNDE